MSKPKRSLRPLDLTSVNITDPFWRPWLEANRRASIPHIYDMCKRTGRIDALRMTWKPGDPNPPHIFWESDVAKWIEAASYILAAQPEHALDHQVDEVIALLAGAQQPDGYLNVHFTLVEPGKRWTNLRDCHEMYCAGHLIEAGVAHFRATGKRSLLDIVRRYADHIDATFGPGKRTGYCGHEEIELALVKLSRATGEPRYLRLAQYFINERGKQPHLFDIEARARGDDPAKAWCRGDYAYYQAHKPVREQKEVVGHAVRAMYLASGMADVAAETGDESLMAACRRLWRSTTARKMYVTGGVGARHHGEAFGLDYELPNESAYAETCAAIGLVLFAHRMLQIEADGQYADVLERALYNGVLAGMSRDGQKYFYVNPLASNGTHHREEFFDCACCPPNIARLLASLGAYTCSAADDGLYVHLYVSGESRAQIAGREVTLRQRTLYPWGGFTAAAVALDGPATFALRLRIPGWCRKYRIAVNGKAVAAKTVKGYATIRREWRSGEDVTLDLEMPTERVAAHPALADDAGRVAIQRGPIVYCLEQCDHKADVRSIILPDVARLVPSFDKRLLGGCVVIDGWGLAPSPAAWKGRLYLPVREAGKPRRVRLRAVPYFLWDNRKPGAMTVWLPRG
jgi:hypothetical protein